MEKIRDKGKSEREARQIQELVGYLGQMSALPCTEVHPVPMPVENRWCDQGTYLERES